MKLYRTAKGSIIHTGEKYFLIHVDWDALINNSDLYGYLKDEIKKANAIAVEEAEACISNHLFPPIGAQEVWAAGVTYLQSRDARIEEAQGTNGGSFYDKAYEASRPELFFKALAHRVSGHGQPVYIREDSIWNVPEPELTLFINKRGAISAYTVGNDMSSRSIEGENPLYLPQAKVYEGSAALGPCLYVSPQPISRDTEIEMSIYREDKIHFSGKMQISRMKRTLTELAEHLNRGLDFPHGCFLMTGTCLVPGRDFTLREGDRITIGIEHIGTLENDVKVYRKRGNVHH